MRTTRRARRTVLALAVVALGAMAAKPATPPGQDKGGEDAGSPAGVLVPADDFTHTAGPLDDGQIEVAVLSTRPRRSPAATR
jgi:hypothetical protein